MPVPGLAYSVSTQPTWPRWRPFITVPGAENLEVPQLKPAIGSVPEVRGRVGSSVLPYRLSGRSEILPHESMGRPVSADRKLDVRVIRHAKSFPQRWRAGHDSRSTRKARVWRAADAWESRCS